MSTNLWRVVVPILLCVCLIPGSAFSDEPNAESADSLDGFSRIDQSEKLAALTDIKMQSILSSIENRRSDAYDSATTRRNGRSQIHDYYGAKKN